MWVHSDNSDFGSVALRQAVFADAHLVWSWNNEEKTRAASIHSEPIPIDQHLAWYAKKLCEEGHYMWIARCDNRDCGVVRIDSRSGDVGTVSITLEPAFRGRGLGRQVILAACRRMLRLRPGETLEAWVATNNRASARCFRSCGFELVRVESADERIFNVYHWEAK